LIQLRGLWGIIKCDLFSCHPSEDLKLPLEKADPKIEKNSLGARWFFLPSGKHTKNYGKSPFLMGKSTISIAIFNSYVTNYQRVSFQKNIDT